MGAYHLATKSGNFGLMSNVKGIFRKFRLEFVDCLHHSKGAPRSVSLQHVGTSEISLTIRVNLPFPSPLEEWVERIDCEQFSFCCEIRLERTNCRRNLTRPVVTFGKWLNIMQWSHQPEFFLQMLAPIATLTSTKSNLRGWIMLTVIWGLVCYFYCRRTWRAAFQFESAVHT